MPKNLHAGIFKWFWAVLSGQNNFVCIFLKNKYGFQIVCFKKIVESAHMPELKKTKDILLKTKDGLLKTETYSWKLKTVQM